MNRYKKEGYELTFIDNDGFKTVNPFFKKKLVFNAAKLLKSFEPINKMVDMYGKF